MKKLVIISLLLLIAGNVFSQGRVNVTIDEKTIKPQSGLSNVNIGLFVSDLLSELNRACENNEKNPKNLQNLFLSDKARRMIEGYWEISPFRFDVSKNPKVLEIVYRDGVPGVKVTMEFVKLPKKCHLSRYESFTIDLNDRGLINEFQLNDKLPYPIIRECILSEERRNYILGFVDQFRRAYCYKSIDSLSKFFKEDAIIVVGRVFKVRQSFNTESRIPGIPFFNKESTELIRLTQYTPEQYFRNLSRVFLRNHYVSVKFEQSIIECVYGTNNIYFFQAKQYWNSSTYNDVGYLTMIWDFSDENNPLVETRIWMPTKIERFLQPDNVTIFTD